jgi:hypothetical protein
MYHSHKDIDLNYLLIILSFNAVWHEKLTKELEKNSVACNPQANYTDRAAAACWRS